MKEFLKVLVAGAIVASSSPAWAVEWTKITENAVSDKFFIDASSMQRSDGIVWYWEYRSFAEPNNAILDTNVSQPVLGAVMRWSADCAGKSQRLRKVNAYTSDRKLIQKFDYGDTGMLLQPKAGSSTAEVMNYVCTSQSEKKPTPQSTTQPQTKPQTVKPTVLPKNR